MLTIETLSKSYGDTLALDRISLEVKRGEVVAIIGPSGSGKSTLIRCVHMLEPYQGGWITLEDEQLGYREVSGRLSTLSDRELARQRADIGMVFQTFNLFPHLSVLQNIVVPQVKVRGRSKEAATERARALLKEVGLADKAESFPRHLSGGQSQRVAIARALAMEPKLLLFDEPTSALDPETVGEVLATIARIAETGATMVIVTHEIEFARRVASRVVFMESGRIVEDGPTEQILGSPSPRLAAFLRHGGDDAE